MKSINNNALVKCSRSISINTSSQQVWKIMTDISNWAKWQTEITNVSVKGEIKPGTVFNWKTAGAKIQSTLHTVEPFLRFGWTGRTFGMFAIHNWTLTENNGVTVVTVDESMEGFLAKAFKRTFNKNLEKGMLNWLDLLKKEAEKSGS